MTEDKTPDLAHETSETRGRFLIRSQEKIVAEMTYSRAGDTTIIVDHTEVDSSLKGQGIGMHLMRAMVDHARSQSLRVLATCPFALAMFKRHPELRDVYGGAGAGSPP